MFAAVNMEHVLAEWEKKKKKKKADPHYVR